MPEEKLLTDWLLSGWKWLTDWKHSLISGLNFSTMTQKGLGWNYKSKNGWDKVIQSIQIYFSIIFSAGLVSCLFLHMWHFGQMQPHYYTQLFLCYFQNYIELSLHHFFCKSNVDMPIDCLWPVSFYRFYVTKHSLDLHSFLQNNYQLAYQNEWWEAIKQLIQAFHPSVHLLLVEYVVFIFND